MGINAEMVVATTTLTVGKEGGPIKASAKLEAVPASEPHNVNCRKEEEAKNCRNVGLPYVPVVPSAPTKGGGKMLKLYKLPSEGCLLWA
jgi:hypothetical protein